MKKNCPGLREQVSPAAPRRAAQHCQPLRAAFAAFAYMGVAVVCSSAAMAAPAIYVNGSPTSVTAIVRANQVFVPVHGVFEKLSTVVTYRPPRTVIARKANANVAQLVVASRTATVNGETRMLKTAPFVSGAGIFVPLRLISEAAGASVAYSAASHAVHITGASVVGAAAPVVAAAPIVAAAPVVTAAPADTAAPAIQQRGIPWWVWLLLALIVLALLFVFFRRRKSEPIVTTRSTTSDPIIKTRR